MNSYKSLMRTSNFILFTNTSQQDSEKSIHSPYSKMQNTINKITQFTKANPFLIQNYTIM